jgi:hypothetical protein
MGHMMRRGPAIVLAFCFLTSCATGRATPYAPIAFPGAEGFGATTKGGRGGAVIKVTNLNDSGTGSLRAAIDAVGPRTIVFDISGTIDLATPLTIRSPNITIAGQSAPGDGIALRGHGLVIAASDVIVRYIRVRPGDINRTETDAISITAGQNIIVDHCSASWSTDETLSVSQQITMGPRQLKNVTVQWSIISESLDRSVHEKGAHGYGSLVRGSMGSNYSFHHNLWAHHRARMPRPGNFADAREDTQGPVFDFTNNVFYNWGGDRDDGAGYNVDPNAISRYQFINNAYRSGPNSKSELAFVESAQGAEAYFSGNSMNGNVVPTQAIVKLKRPEMGYFAAAPFVVGLVRIRRADRVEAQVLARAGASLHRDSVDIRIVENVRQKSGAIIDSQTDVGGWPVLKTMPPHVDTDGDGMPDSWERHHRLNPIDPSDGPSDRNGHGFTELENWLNSLVD